MLCSFSLRAARHGLACVAVALMATAAVAQDGWHYQASAQPHQVVVDADNEVPEPIPAVPTPDEPSEYDNTTLSDDCWSTNTTQQAPYSPVGGCCCCCNDIFYVGFEFLWLEIGERGGGNRDLIFADNGGAAAAAPTPQGVALNANDLDLGSEMAFRSTFGAYIGCTGERVEGRFFWIGDEDNLFTAVGQLAPGDYSLGTQLQNNGGGAGATTASVGSLLNVNRVFASRRVDVGGIELNYYGSSYEFGCRWSGNALIGFRGIMYDEEIELGMQIPQAPSAAYRSDAQNRIFGVQFGTEASYMAYHSDSAMLHFNWSGKAGFGGNIASLDINLQNADPVNNPDAPDDSEIVFTTFGEVALGARLTYKQFIGTIGYEALFVSNVEMGGVPSDLFIVGADQPGADDQVMIHGFYAGCQIAW